MLLLIEISERSADYGREVKLPLYAGAGIAGVWIVHLGVLTIEIHADPRHNAYEAVTVARRRQTIVSQTVAGHSLAPDDIPG